MISGLCLVLVDDHGYRYLLDAFLQGNFHRRDASSQILAAVQNVVEKAIADAAEEAAAEYESECDAAQAAGPTCEPPPLMVAIHKTISQTTSTTSKGLRLSSSSHWSSSLAVL